jgi:hypothetical protein
VTSAADKPAPENGAFLDLLKMYQDQGRRREAADLVTMWRRRMPEGYVIAFDLVPFMTWPFRCIKTRE